jgi:hypothetical protein
MSRRLLWSLIPLLGGLCACAHQHYIPGTKIPDEPRNREIVQVVEKYRHAVQDMKVADLMAMAHPHYYEHSGTPIGNDDYSYKGLLKVIRTRIGQLVTMRCNLKYLRVRWQAEHIAEVEIYISANFQLKTAEGERWHRMTDYNKMVLVKERGRWQFIRGM